jgi:hypothetical protein
LVDYREYGITSFTSWELGDEIHGYYLEGECRGVRWQVEERCLPFMGDVFVLLARCAAFYVFGHPFVHSWPPEHTGHRSYGLVPSGVSCRGSSMVVVEDILLELFVWWNHDPSLCMP